jgi:cytoskeleton protein RodZ
VNDATENGPDAADASLLRPGAQLQAARERAGWTPERLAAELGLAMDRLQALERDDYTSFGGVVFVRGYLRRAATLLGLPPGELIAAYEACCNGVKPADVRPGLPPGERPRRGAPGWSGPALGVMAIAAMAGGTWWALGPDHDLSPALRVSEAPRLAMLEFSVPAEDAAAPRPMLPEPESVPEPVPESASEPASTAPEPAGLPDPVTTMTDRVAGTVAESLGRGAVSQPAMVVEVPEPAAPPPGTVELRFEFTEECWLEVTDAEDRRLAYRLYRPGDVARLRGTAPVSVFLGNADGVRLTVDGAALALRPASRRDGTARLTVGGGAG